MDTSRYIQSCNPARFVITCSLLIFSVLFALRIDEYITISYWLVFLPLSIWKMLVVFGACTGVFIWCKSGEQNRRIRTLDNDCRELIIYFLIHIFIFAFELLICDKLENHLEIRWSLCFIPILICIILFFASCIWSLKVQRNFLIQTFILSNGLFFLFFPLRLDYLITWRYVVVFIPVWISLCIALLFVIMKMILAIVHRCSRRLLANQRESGTIIDAILYATMFISLSIFSILLVNRLDNDQIGRISYTVIAIPLYIALFAWMMFSFGATDGNLWWFGLHRNICDIILEHCPSVSLYFNNKYKLGSHSSTNEITIDMTSATTQKTLESSTITKYSATNTNNEKILTTQHQLLSLLEPD